MDFDKIQQEIMNRSRQMYRNAPNFHQNGQSRQQKANTPDNGRAHPHAEQKPKQEQKQLHNEEASQEKNTTPQGFMDILMADKERSLIILLIILLSEEHVDSTVILALMYLII